MVDLAYAAALPPGGGGIGAAAPQILFFAAIFAIFYFLLIRPQQKQKKERQRMLTALKKGDRAVTNGGLHGIVVGLSEHIVTLKVADQVKVEVDRSAISRVVVQGDKESS